MPTDFVCDECGGLFLKGWSDEEADQERLEVFGERAEDEEEDAILCDTCYRKVLGDLIKKYAGRPNA